MPDAVVDACFLAVCNGSIAGRRPGNILDRRLQIIEDCVYGRRRACFNGRLLHEYSTLVADTRNDIVSLFLRILDTDVAHRAARSTLSRQQYQEARACRWPAHDQHLLAAALDEPDEPAVFSTEDALLATASCIRRRLSVEIAGH